MKRTIKAWVVIENNIPLKDIDVLWIDKEAKPNEKINKTYYKKLNK